jgi:glycosyltransferase involved in cell wall biosynthesis
MNDSPLFSVLTAAYNNEATIRQTIESVKKQTFQSLEHIVIDGKSQDNTCNILSQYEDTYRLCWISETDNGIADALNKGLRKAKGRYIIVIQADDCLLNANSLEKAYSLLKYERVDILSLPVIYNHPIKGKRLIKPIKLLWWNHLKHIFHHQGCFVHKRVFDKIGEFRKEFKINMDYDFFFRALACKSSVHFGKFPVVLMSGSGISSVFAYKRIKEERLVQMRNERNQGWRMAQFIFRSLYMPYKKFRIS